MLAFKIALRYLLAPKSHRAVNVISIVSVAGVAVAAMAIVVVLSVFNGFADLADMHLAKIDPQVKVVPIEGKAFEGADSLACSLESLPQIVAASPTITERALLVADGGEQMPVKIKAFDFEDYSAVVPLQEIVIDGNMSSSNGLPDSLAAVQLSVGVALHTGLRPSPVAGATVYVPRRIGRVNPANPAAAYKSERVAVSGVFQVDQPEYDNDFVFVPIFLARELLGYDKGEASALELAIAPGVSQDHAVAAVEKLLPDGFKVLTRAQQQADTFRMISVEKWVTFLVLVFILLIASFNIVSTLSLLVIEKKDNMKTLRFLGASRNLVSKIFMWEGWLITVIGGAAGIMLGLFLAWVQQEFGLVKLAADPRELTISVYPVRIAWADILAVAVTVVVLGWLLGQVSKVFTRKIFR